MRKALAILIVLVILCTSGIIAAHAVVNTQRDQVTINENVIYGDKLAADGLNIIRKADWDSRLHWQTDYNISSENSYCTDFHFTQNREYERIRSEPTGSISLGLTVGSGMGSSHEITREDITNLAAGYEELCLDVMEAAPAGEEYSDIVQVSDYFDFFPLQVYLDFPNVYRLESRSPERYYVRPIDGEDCTEVNEALNKYFKFPVSDEDLVMVELYKNDNGEVTELNISTLEWATEFWVLYAVTPSGAYFAFDCGDDIDFTNIKGGCGIYCLPFNASFEYGGETYPTVNTEELGMVYSLDENTRIENMFYEEEQNRLVLITVENNMLMFTTIDLATMEMLQRIEICECEEDRGVWRTSRDEDFITLYLGSDRIVVLEMLDNGEYSLEFVVNVRPEGQDELFWYNSNSTKAYDGERLAMCWSRDIEEAPYSDCGFYVAIYDKTGLLYFGEYLSGLMTGRNANDYGYYCNPIDISLNWK